MVFEYHTLAPVCTMVRAMVCCNASTNSNAKNYEAESTIHECCVKVAVCSFYFVGVWGFGFFLCLCLRLCACVLSCKPLQSMSCFIPISGFLFRFLLSLVLLKIVYCLHHGNYERRNSYRRYDF